MNINSKIKNSKGYAIEQRINQFFLTKYIFKHNYLALQSHLDQQLQKDQAFKLAHAQNREELHDIQLETVRHLHNFIASALSLIDHSRRFQRKLFKGNEAFNAEYQSMVDNTFVNNLLSAFIVCFRQYVQHYQIPKISNVTNLVDKAADIRAKIVIAKHDLLDFSGWNAPAQKFVDELEKELNIVTTMEAYYQLITDFQGWFERRQVEIFKPELDELNALKAEAITEDMKTTVMLFTGTEELTNDAFIYHMTRHFSAEQAEYYKKLNAVMKIDFLIWVLKENKLINSLADEQVIRNKLTY